MIPHTGVSHTSIRTLRRTMHRPFLRVFGPLALAATSLLVCLLVAEGAVRIVAPQQLLILRGDIWQPVDSLGWNHRPNLATSINTGEGSVHVFTDHRGYRVGEHGPVDGERTVLLLGDSFMAAFQVEYEESVAGLMERGLAASMGAPVAVRNAAVGAWDPPHYLIKIRRALDREPADLAVVALYLGNDIVDWNIDAFDPRDPTPRPEFRLPRSLGPGAWIEGILRPADFHLRRVSHLHVLARSRLLELRMRLGLSAIYFPEEFLASEADSFRWDLTEEILGNVAAEAQARNVPLVFVMLPTHFQVERGRLEQHLRVHGLDPAEVRIDQPNEILGERLRRRGLTVLDPLPDLRAAYEDGERLYGGVDPHFSAAGHRVTWTHVADTLAALLRSAPLHLPYGSADAQP
jgi:hypothetical protein